jgi:hypothetical protein
MPSHSESLFLEPDSSRRVVLQYRRSFIEIQRERRTLPLWNCLSQCSFSELAFLADLPPTPHTLSHNVRLSRDYFHRSL